jgi:hypothetical protein
MPSWGNKDNAANTPLWAATTIKRTPTSANQTAFYANTTANTFITGQTIGLFGIDASEIANTQQRGVAQTGWVVKTTGQGGRANRITYETLVCLANLTLDGDSTTIANTANP